MDVKLLGVVMAGGKSSRMGTDKGRHEFAGVPMAVRVRSLLSQVGLDVVVSVNETQVSEYELLFPDTQLVVDALPELGGPLRGILSVHAAFPTADLLVVACDMPLLGISVLRRLSEEHIAIIGREESADEPTGGTARVPFVAFDSDGIQPLCALYRASALAALLARVRTGNLPPFCPRKLMASTPGTRLLEPRDSGERLQFTNVNRPEELSAARSVLG